MGRPTNPRQLSGIALILTCLCLAHTAQAGKIERLAPDVSHRRRPVALARLDRETAVVANQHSGTLSVVDLGDGSVVAEFATGGRPTDLAMHGKHVFMTDARRSMLSAINVSRDSARVVWELPLPTEPVSVHVSPDRHWCSVCALWARKVVLVQLPEQADEANPAKIVATIDLPFSPREQLYLPDSSRLVVADAFGGRLAAISLKSQKLEALHELPAHNIRGLALHRDGKHLLVAHQILNEYAPPRPSDIIWGVMITNGIRMLPLANVLDPQAEVMNASRFLPLGDGSRGAGDPDDIAVDEDGHMVVALAGIGEAALIEPDGYSLQRVPVGERPTAVLPLGRKQFLVANEFSDSVSLIDLTADLSELNYSTRGSAYDEAYAAPSTYSIKRDGGKDADVGVRQISLGNAPPADAARRGEALFFNARLSHGNWFSCHSCHTDGHTNGGLADTLSDGSDGSPKRILSLLGVGETGPWAWKGDKSSLHEQVQQSARSTMQGRKLSEQQTSDLVAYLKTLEPPPKFQPAQTAADRALVKQGRALFESLDCTSCHNGETLTSADTYDVGLTDERGTKQFNPPSLRGVGHRAGLFHKKQAERLEDVVGKSRHQLPRTLSPDEQEALLRYLRSL